MNSTGKAWPWLHAEKSNLCSFLVLNVWATKKITAFAEGVMPFWAFCESASTEFLSEIILAACCLNPYCLPNRILKCRGSTVLYSVCICVHFYRSTDCVGNNTHIHTDMCLSCHCIAHLQFRQVAQSLKQSPHFVHAYAMLAPLAWLYSVSHVSLFSNSLSTAACSNKRRRTLASQLAENRLKTNGNQVSKMRICLDVTWLPLVFPAESSDSVLVLFLSLWKSSSVDVRYGKNRAWCGFWWLYLGRHYMLVVHLSYRWRGTRGKKSH